MGRICLVHAPCAYALHLTTDDDGTIVLWCAWCNVVVGRLSDVEARHTRSTRVDDMDGRPS
ncbi:MAG: hypothetical protein EPN91_00075 [Salinibacterium sp.]|nr:MAG: hypothetical protein EPN91_00075 [Salinibacterium sp.]